MILLQVYLIKVRRKLDLFLFQVVIKLMIWASIINLLCCSSLNNNSNKWLSNSKCNKDKWKMLLLLLILRKRWKWYTTTTMLNKWIHCWGKWIWSKIVIWIISKIRAEVFRIIIMIQVPKLCLGLLVGTINNKKKKPCLYGQVHRENPKLFSSHLHTRTTTIITKQVKSISHQAVESISHQATVTQTTMGSTITKWRILNDKLLNWNKNIKKTKISMKKLLK